MMLTASRPCGSWYTVNAATYTETEPVERYASTSTTRNATWFAAT